MFLQFTAIETENGWAFRNKETQEYLGINNMVASLPSAPRLSCVKKRFSWVVLPHHEDIAKFKSVSSTPTNEKSADEGA
jgi:hypothetical protein